MRADSAGELWLVPTTDGQLCVVEKPPPGGYVLSRFACNQASIVEKHGLVGGVPGDWYGVVPDGVTHVVATVAGNPVAVPVSENTYRLPTSTSAVTVGQDAPLALPGGR